jgi:hypothetical protein
MACGSIPTESADHARHEHIDALQYGAKGWALLRPYGSGVFQQCALCPPLPLPLRAEMILLLVGLRTQ